MPGKKRTLRDDWDQLTGNLSGNQKAGIGCFGLFFLIMLIVVINSLSNRSKDNRTAPIQEQPRASSELKASVRFNGTQFIVTNNDAFDWANVKLEINGGIISGGYQLTTASMKSGETYTIGAMQFADSDGKRFNPFQMKPQKFRITANTPNGSSFYLGGWD